MSTFEPGRGRERPTFTNAPPPTNKQDSQELKPQPKELESTKLVENGFSEQAKEVLFKILDL